MGVDNMRVLNIDIDGVVADLLTPWLDYYNSRTGESIKKSDITCWDLEDCLRHKEVIHEFLYLPGVYRNLEVIGNAKKVLKELNKDFKLQFVTDTPFHARDDRLYWVQKHFPYIKDIYFAEDKSNIKADLILDDRPENLISFPGIKVCFDHEYNKNIPVTHYRVKDIEEFFRLVYRFWG